MVPDVYELNLATSGKLKLRASARLAEGEPGATFEACVLLHEAARMERRSIDALPRCPPETRLRSSIEECWCYVEGRDPLEAARARGRVLQDLGGVDAATGAAMLARLNPRLEASDRELNRVLEGARHLKQLRGDGSFIPATKEEQRAAHQEVRRLLAAFPGASVYWWASYRLLEALGEKKAAWKALQNAQRLAPHDQRFLAMSLLLAAQALSEDEADEHLDHVRASLEKASASVCLMYAHAELELAKKAASARARWLRALDATNAGLTRAPSPSLRRNLKATQLLLQALQAGEVPSIDILYLADLGDSVTGQSTKNVADLVTRVASRDVAANASVDQAAA